MEVSEIAERMTAFLTTNEEKLEQVSKEYPKAAKHLEEISRVLEELNETWEKNMTNFITKYNSQTNLKENDLYTEIDVITEVLLSYLETINEHLESIRSIVGDEVAAEIKKDSELFFGNYLNEMNEYVRRKTQVGGRRNRQSRRNKQSRRSRKNKRQNRRTQKQRGGHGAIGGDCNCTDRTKGSLMTFPGGTQECYKNNKKCDEPKSWWQF